MFRQWVLLAMLFTASGAGAAATVEEWDQLIPPQFHPAKIMARHGVRYLDLSKPEEKVIFDEIEQARHLAPVERAVDGSTAKLRGFVVPLDGDGAATTEFLLVPEYGYCIHVPPPPANQLILVHFPQSEKAWPVFAEVEVRGVLKIESVATGNGRAGYILQAAEVVSVN